MSDLRKQRAVLLSALLAITGFCGGGLETTLETEALARSEAAHATGIPAGWLRGGPGHPAACGHRR